MTKNDYSIPIKKGDFAKPVLACIAKNGICHTGGNCDSCDFAKKFVFSKKLFQLIEECDCRNSSGMCVFTSERCTRTDCEMMLKEAAAYLKGDV